MIYNNKNQPTQIEDIPVTSFVYFGVTIQKQRDCYKLHRIESMNKAKKYTNLMSTIIARSCNKLLIEKTYWESAALPSILHGTEIIFLSIKIHNIPTKRSKQGSKIHSECKKGYSHKRITRLNWIISTDFQGHEVKDFPPQEHTAAQQLTEINIVTSI